MIYIVEIHQSVDHLSSREDYTAYLKILVRSSIWLLNSSKFHVVLRMREIAYTRTDDCFYSLDQIYHDFYAFT